MTKAIDHRHRFSRASGRSETADTSHGVATSQADMEIALETDTTGVAIFDGFGRLTYTNAAFRKIYHLDPEQLPTPLATQRLVELLGATFRREIDALKCLVPSKFLTAHGLPEYVRCILSDGATVQVCHHLSPGGGWVSRHSQVNLSWHAEVNNELVSLQALVDQLPDYLWVKDSQSRFVVANLALAMDCGKTASSALIGLTDFDLHSPDKAAKFHARELEVLRSGVPMIDEEEGIVDAVGQIKWFSSSKIPLRSKDGDIVGLIGIARDITARRKAEELRQHATNLEETSQQLTLALEQERKLNMLQRQFVSMASHEFRTPLAIIDGAAQRLVRHKNTPSSEFVSEKSRVIREAVGRIVELMESILSSNKLDDGRGNFSTTKFSLRHLLQTCCGRQQDIALRHRILCDLDQVPDSFAGDRSAMEQVFTNLLSNAVKYSPHSPEILVQGRIEEGRIKISIRDFGLGIDADDLPKMFERYFRARTSTGIAGTGIGLNLVKQIVEYHDGTIAVESAAGEGSVFTVSLPAGRFVSEEGY